jgi:predicted ABC-type transport system involved in lysophospholipase L1 biosynthesis ATPase subunit
MKKDSPVCVELRNVSLNYLSNGQNVHALQDVTLAIRQGEFVAIVGPSGCGKTTILKLVAGLLPPTRGEVLIDGTPVKGPQKNVGMAFQNPILLPWRTALENVLLPLEIVQPHRQEFARNRRQYEEQALHLLHTVGLEGFADRAPYELSGGMQQRVSSLSRPDPSAGDLAAGRTFCCARRLYARGAVGRPANTVAGPRLHGHSGHARPARSGLPGEQGLRDEQAAGQVGAGSARRSAATAYAGKHL